jgi:hypothetical protein
VVTDKAAESNAVIRDKENERNILVTDSASESNAVVTDKAAESKAVDTNRATKSNGVVDVKGQNDEILADDQETPPEQSASHRERSYSKRERSYLESCITSFFSEYALLSDLYEPLAAKTIHLFSQNDAQMAAIEAALVKQLVPLLNNVDPLVIAVDAADQTFNAQSQLSGWTGLASVITQEGIYHVTSNGGNEYELDGDVAFLSWQAFIAFAAGLQQRLMMPDIWLGTPTEVLIKGSYFNFSTNIIGWIEFSQGQQAQFLERFNQLSMAIISTESL